MTTMQNSRQTRRMVDFGEVLLVECPRCGTTDEDVFETLNERTPTDWSCYRCRRSFSVLLTDCDTCAHENLATAMSSAEQIAPRDVRCECCGKWCLTREDE